MLLSTHSVGTNQETSWQATRQETLGHSCLSSLSYCGLIMAYKSGISVREQISTKKKKKMRAGGEWIVEHTPKILAREEKAHNTDDRLSVGRKN